MYDNFTPLVRPGTIVSPLQVANAASDASLAREAEAYASFPRRSVLKNPLFRLLKR